ncbi:MAG: NAD(P)-dependent glycerol-3-phosphate dehydrogenase [Alphaproteobacteria bacterium]|nr:NAD(P)-dependent glycerol-3-phosphate dehydrogenase [Alphaproteobacteria bacterium]MCB9793000.1 NAD(P)-dependent glycerol-3-phosphate dehydrogenase [Alphaproteobacteria bacterium]
MRCAVVGAGSFGTALGMQLGRCGHEVRVWDRRADRAAAHEAARENSRYLPGFPFPDTMHVTADLAEAVAGATLVVAVVPSQSMREVMAEAGPHMDPNAIVCSAAKGVEEGTLATMDEVLQEALPPQLRDRVCAISGPSFAKEVAQDMPTAVVVAGRDEIATHRVAGAFHGSAFRVYHSTDLVGVEVGGAIKNVMAIACGVADGMGMGLNARAAIITRGLAEITRLAMAKGAQPMTLAGLAGMGDLVLTCTGDLSRNRRVGLALGQGRTLDEILEELGQVAEGVRTTRSARELGGRLGVELPITEQVYKIIYEQKPAQEALADLLGRRRKAELEDPTRVR